MDTQFDSNPKQLLFVRHTNELIKLAIKKVSLTSMSPTCDEQIIVTVQTKSQWNCETQSLFFI